MGLTFQQANFIVGFVSGVHPTRASSLESRIKQWQKMGFPEGVNVGRGVKAQYGATQLLQLMLLLKLLTVGLTPERAITVVRKGWPLLRDQFVEAVSCIAAGSDHLHYSLIKLDALTDLKEPSSDHLHIYVGQATSEDLSFAMSEANENWQEDDRKVHQAAAIALKNQLAVSIVLELDSILVLLWIAVKACGGDLAIFQDEFLEWYDARASAGVQEQPSIEFFLNFYQSSAIQGSDNFDRVEAARVVLSKVNDRAQHSQA
jgi:hypothetical protein